MKNRLHVIPLDLLIDLPPEPEPARMARLWALPGTVSWGWCLVFALVQLIVGGILLLCSMNPGGMSYVLTLVGFSSALTQCFPEGRAQPLVCLLTPYGVLSILGSVVGFPSSVP